MFYLFNWGSVILVIAIIWLYYKVRRLEERVDKVSQSGAYAPVASQDDTHAHETLAEDTPVVAYDADVATVTPGERIQGIREEVTQEKRPSRIGALFHWLATDWLMKVGALILLIGIGWFVSYAFLHNWIGPVGRITLGVLFGVAVMALGVHRFKSFVNQGAILVALGVGVILITIYAGQEFYNFFTPTMSLVFMFVTTAFAALVSVRYVNFPLALVSLILANIAPMMVSYHQVDIIGFFMYLLVVNAGILWVSGLMGWRALPLVSLTIAMLYSGDVSVYRLNDQKSTMTLIAFLFTGMYYLVGIASMLKAKVESRVDLLVAVTNAVWVLLWIDKLIMREVQSLVTAAWAFVFAVGAFLVYKQTQRHKPFFIYGGIAAVLIGVATAMELDGASLTIAYIFEVGFLVLMTQVLTRNTSMTKKMSFLFAVPMLLSLASMEMRVWQDTIMNKHFFVLAILAAVLFALGYFFYKKKDTQEVKTGENFISTFFAFGVVYTFILLWLVLHIAFVEGVATTLSMILYTIVGLSLDIYGRLKEVKPVRIFGAVILGFVVLRLLFVDVWDLELTARIATFIIVGVMLVSAALINRPKKEKHEEI